MNLRCCQNKDHIGRRLFQRLGDALSLLERCIAFHYGQELTYDKALEVLGAVDTDVARRAPGYNA